MNRETSIYLDFVRLSAALVVMVGHLSGKRFSDGLFWQVGQFMDDAVTVFFVLSGFVIAHVVGEKEVTPQKYVIARAARIYSVALPALVVTFLLDEIGRFIAPALYNETWGYRHGSLLIEFLSGLFFLNQIWNLQIQVGSMLPYWSLGFEVWYYIFFGIVFFAPAKWKAPLVMIAFLCAGPRIVALFPIWLLGYGTYRLVSRTDLAERYGPFCLAMSIVGYVAYFVLLKPWLLGHDVVAAALGVPGACDRYVVGLLFSLHLIGISGVPTLLRAALGKAEGIIRWASGATFTIYLFHVPVAQFLTTLTPWGPSSWKTRAIIFGGTSVLMFAIAEVTERRKRLWSDWITTAYERAAKLSLGFGVRRE